VSLVPHERVHEQLQPKSEGERLVRLLAAERDPMETSVTIGSPVLLGIPIASGFVPASFGPPDG
jgi:hypothetical protein